jgi:hypothetical protein
MFNPLLEDLSHLKDTELDEKMSDLNRKYSIALKMGNGAVANQIVMVLNSLREEMLRRQSEATKKLMQRQDKDLDGLINVG